MRVAMRRGAAASCALLALAMIPTTIVPARTPGAVAGPDVINYTVRRGDTLYALGQRYFTRSGDYLIVQRLNRVARDREIPPGTTISIPVRVLRSQPLEARVLAFRGIARVNGLAAALDASVTQGAVIETGAESSLTIGLSNGSRINLPTNSRLRIVAMRRYLLEGRLDFDFVVERGRIDTSVTKLPNPGSRYRVRTPYSISSVRGTSFRIATGENDAPALTEVVDGTVGVGAGSAAAVPIEKGFGVGVSPHGGLRKEALLPPPDPVRPGKVQNEELVRLTLAPVAGAVAYHVELSSDAGFVDVLRESDAADPAVQFGDVPDGRYFVRATAVAASGLRGMPRIYTMRRVRADLTAGAGPQGWAFRWAPGKTPPNRVYHFQIVPKKPGALPIVDESGVREGGLTLSTLPPGTYTWRVAIREYGPDGVSEDWLGQSDLLVSAPE